MVTDKVILQEIKQTCLEKLVSTAEEENIILCTQTGGSNTRPTTEASNLGMHHWLQVTGSAIIN